MSYDYLDFDVYINVRTFYSLAGYQVSLGKASCNTSLLVILRGIPPSVNSDFFGLVHVYDYVREHNLDYRSYFPNAAQITTVSLVPGPIPASSDSIIVAYLPVIWQLWMFKLPLLFSDSTPVHIGNHKPLSSDPYQEQLISLAQKKLLRIYGGKWFKRGINARPLSYLEANTILSNSSYCYGLMYPYQRGNSLSGRMWQAPIHGCCVLSEFGTNLLNLPGVHEVENFTVPYFNSLLDSTALSKEARSFWQTQTETLALSLGLKLDLKRLRYEVLLSSALLIGQHIYFLLNINYLRLSSRTKKITNHLVKHFRCQSH